MEIWKRIDWDFGVNAYEVSNYGLVRKLARASIAKYGADTKARIMRFKKHKKGYLELSVSSYGKSKKFFIHRLVALAFVANPDTKPCVNHLDGDKENNHFSNLEWCTSAENNDHATRNNLIRCRLTWDQKQFIKANFFRMDRNELADMLNVSQEVIYRYGTNRDGKRPKNTIKVTESGGRKKRMKTPPVHRPVIDLLTGIFWTAEDVAFLLGTKRRYVHRMLAEERKPNTSQFRYA